MSDRLFVKVPTRSSYNHVGVKETKASVGSPRCHHPSSLTDIGGKYLFTIVFPTADIQRGEGGAVNFKGLEERLQALFLFSLCSTHQAASCKGVAASLACTRWITVQCCVMCLTRSGTSISYFTVLVSL